MPLRTCTPLVCLFFTSLSFYVLLVLGTKKNIWELLEQILYRTDANACHRVYGFGHLWIDCSGILHSFRVSYQKPSLLLSQQVFLRGSSVTHNDHVKRLVKQKMQDRNTQQLWRKPLYNLFMLITIVSFITGHQLRWVLPSGSLPTIFCSNV